MSSNANILSFSPHEAYEHLKDNAAIVDIRPEYEVEYRTFDVPRMYYLPYDSYQDTTIEIPRDILLIVADSAGNRSAEVALYLQEQGYPEVACLAGGVLAWVRAGLPLVKDDDYELSGACACRLRPQKVK